jgi:hypothetical protein
MPNLERGLGRGTFILGLIVLAYLVWPYLVDALAVIGAIQLYCVWRQRPRNEQLPGRRSLGTPVGGAPEKSKRQRQFYFTYQLICPANSPTDI